MNEAVTKTVLLRISEKFLYAIGIRFSDRYDNNSSKRSSSDL